MLLIYLSDIIDAFISLSLIILRVNWQPSDKNNLLFWLYYRKK